MKVPRSLISYVLLLSLPVVLEAAGYVRLTPILTYAYIMSVYALSFSMPLRYLGLLNFGHALFFGFGAYVTVYQLIWLAMPYPIAILVALPTGMLLGICLALISRKAFRGIPFAFLSLTVLLIVYSLYRRRELRSISGSEQGLQILPPEILSSEAVPILSTIVFAALLTMYTGRLLKGDPRSGVSGVIESPPGVTATRQSRSLLIASTVTILYILVAASLVGVVLSKPGPYRVTINLYIVSLTVLYLSYMLLDSISRSPIALSWIIIRDNEVRAGTMGYNVFALKAVALAISGTLASTAGGLYIAYSLGVSPERAFNPLLSVYGLIYCVVGGLYTLEGPIVGAVLVTLIENYLADYLGGWSQVFTGLLFITAMLFLPQGVAQHAVYILKKSAASLQRAIER